MTRRPQDAGGDEPTRSGWDRDRKIQVGHIVSTVALALTLAGTLVRVTMYTGAMETRLAVVEAHQTQQRERDAMQDKAATDGNGAIMVRFDRLEQKLDRVAEAVYRKPR